MVAFVKEIVLIKLIVSQVYLSRRSRGDVLTGLNNIFPFIHLLYIVEMQFIG